MKTVIFDMDGVLIDSEHVYQELEEKMFFDLGVTLTKEMKKNFVGTSMVKLWTMVKDNYNLDFDVDDMIEKERVLYLDKLKQGHIDRVDGSYELMSMFYKNGYTLGLGTASKRKEAEILTETFGFSKMLSTIVSSSDVEHSKPFPDIYLKAAKNLGSDVSSCVVIEDSANGIKAAKAAGAKVIALKNEFNTDYSKADLVVNSLYDINLDMIESL